ncbi:MAG: hypothetical protein IJ600_09370 [Lachnospiraceae bacterium]|nr:hypothetical protein [Lachnospiraceae bacterium]
MKEPIYSTITCIPGSKEKLAREHGYHNEICEDTAASAINYILQYGLKPMILRGMVICGNFNYEKLYQMAQTLQRCCKENDVMFAGMEIGAQPVNFDVDTYHLNVTVSGVADSCNYLDRKYIQEGDILIGIETSGMDGVNYPMLKVMMDRKPELIHTKVEGDTSLLDLLLKPNRIYTKAAEALQEYHCVRALYRVNNHLFNEKLWRDLPDGLSANIELSALPIRPLYQFLHDQDMVGEKVFQYHFHMGVGMIAVVPKECADQAMELIGRTENCWRIGRIVKNEGENGKAWKSLETGELKWK